MTYKQKKHIFWLVIYTVVAIVVAYRIGYYYGTIDATQEVSDELLEYCESKIDTRANEICGK